LKSAGHQIGWGFQLQSPVFVGVIVVLLFVLGLSLSGFVEVGASLMGVGSGLAQHSGYKGSFFTGVLAVIVATPCRLWASVAVFVVMLLPGVIKLFTETWFVDEKATTVFGFSNVRHGNLVSLGIWFTSGY